MPGFRALLLVRVLAAGRGRRRDAARAAACCGTAPAAGPQRDEIPVMSRYAWISHRGIPGADHDRGQFRTLSGRFWPRP
jgi:hypothetical protein